MFGFGLFAVTLGAVNVSTTPFMWLGIAGALFALIFFGVPALTGKKVTLSQAVSLSGRAINFLRHIDSLGAPVFAPLLKALSEGNAAGILSAATTIFDQFDDKAMRSGILERLDKTRVLARLAKPDDREWLLKLVEDELGVKIPRNAEQPTATLLEARTGAVDE